MNLRRVRVNTTIAILGLWDNLDISPEQQNVYFSRAGRTEDQVVAIGREANDIFLIIIQIRLTDPPCSSH